MFASGRLDSTRPLQVPWPGRCRLLQADGGCCSVLCTIVQRRQGLCSRRKVRSPSWILLEDLDRQRRRHRHWVHAWRHRTRLQHRLPPHRYADRQPLLLRALRHQQRSACVWMERHGKASAGCLFGPTGSKAGDLGHCAELCDCDSDCRAPLGCHQIDPIFAKAYGRAGGCGGGGPLVAKCADAGTSGDAGGD